MSERSVPEILNLYNPADPLEKASTIPAPWYFDARIALLERHSVFASNWQVVGRLDQVKDPGQFSPSMSTENPCSSCAVTMANSAPFTTSAAITPLPSNLNPPAARNNFAALTTVGLMQTTVPSRAWSNLKVSAILIAKTTA